VRATLPSRKSLPQPLPVLLINLDREPERLAATTAAFEGDERFAVTRVPGVLGSILPGVAAERLTGNRIRRDGTLGCYLAHVSAWERVANGTSRFALIIEDDVAIRRPGKLFDTPLPGDAELVFCNKRMVLALDRAQAAAGEVMPVRDAAPGLGGAIRAPGGEGYLLSRRGAKKLLRATKQRSFGGHVDWRLLQIALTREEYTAAAKGTGFGEITQLRWDSQHDLVGWGVLKGYVLRDWIVSQRPNVSSRRAADGPDVPKPTHIPGLQVAPPVRRKAAQPAGADA